MAWQVEYANEFGAWWHELAEAQREDSSAVILLLEEYGPQLPFPYSSGISGARLRCLSRRAQKGRIAAMTGHRPFRELTALVPAKARARIAAMRDEMTLSELRHARAMSQDDVAASLSVQQPAVAKLERRTDMHISSLRRYVEALGGKLEITARFSDASVSIGSLAERNDASLSDPV